MNPGQNFAVAKTFWQAILLDHNGRPIQASFAGNVITNQGLNFWLDTMFQGTTAISTWYLVPFSNNVTPVVADTYASHGYTEYSGYSEAARQAWNHGAASGQQIVSSSATTYSITESVTIYGGALVGGSATKGDTAASAYLFSAAKFGSPLVAASGNTLSLYVTNIIANG